MSSNQQAASSGVSPQFLIASAVVLALVASFWSVDIKLLSIWSTQSDMSHGFFVPVISLWLLWFRADKAPKYDQLGGWGAFAIGLAIIALGIAMRCSGILFRTTIIEAWSIILVALGMVVAVGGIKGLRWAWPSVLFLAFMLPLPASIGGVFGANLQAVATVVSNYTLQLIGVPAVAEGNVIWLSTRPLGVAEACNGLRMLTAFFAISVACCFILDRPLWQKLVLVASAPVVGIVANVFRITLIGVIYEQGPSEATSVFVHDLAGWLMMPLAIVILMIELWVLSGIVLPDESEFSYPDEVSV
ncbi:exosortase [Bremerella cremea]|uniref:Exosortase n=1 Tax=Bremerella cremea TaxID=1031537 RepID=A0A368KP69_9BACT|nr:exosortase/archaeosortase family protein [Bremerella cremea]RCS46343.1 exosortase [Bremerella cremea]